jgi:hypothetical protein
MAVQVEAALQHLAEDNIIIVHCFYNVAYMARSEEEGDLPIRRYPNGEFHMEGDLALAANSRLHMFFRNCLPFLRLLEGRLDLFLTHLGRYLLNSCCNRAYHAPNRQDEDFVEQMQKGLQDCRNVFKDFLFTSGLRGFAVVNPSLCVPVRTRQGSLSWEWTRSIPSMRDTTGSSILCAQKPAGLPTRVVARRGRPVRTDRLERKPRTEAQRPRWVDESPSSTTMRGGPARGSARGRGYNDSYGGYGSRGGGYSGDSSSGRGGECGG